MTPGTKLGQYEVLAPLGAGWDQLAKWQLKLRDSGHFVPGRAEKVLAHPSLTD